MNIVKGNSGWIEVICGGMFSGKTEELIRRLRRAQIARLQVEIFAPAIDVRYEESHIVSHSQMRLKAKVVSTAGEIMQRVSEGVDVIGIDEAQFFDSTLVEICNDLANRGKRVIVAGLDQDYMGQPFEPMPHLLAIAEYITKTLAICVQCGNPANYSQRLVANTDRVLVGASGIYEARCRRCFIPGVAAEKPSQVEQKV